ncbi:hypothetical protein ACQKPX_00225 [Photobacterium sp. DNB23_23_1]
MSDLTLSLFRSPLIIVLDLCDFSAAPGFGLWKNAYFLNNSRRTLLKAGLLLKSIGEYSKTIGVLENKIPPYW